MSKKNQFGFSFALISSEYKTSKKVIKSGADSGGGGVAGEANATSPPPPPPSGIGTPADPKGPPLVLFKKFIFG